MIKLSEYAGVFRCIENIQCDLVLPFYFNSLRPAYVNKALKARETTLDTRKNENILGAALHSTNLNILTET